MWNRMLAVELAWQWLNPGEPRSAFHYAMPKATYNLLPPAEAPTSFHVKKGKMYESLDRVVTKETAAE